MRLTLAEAARRVGRSRTALLRSIKAGRLSAERDPLRGDWRIDMSELSRLYPDERDAPDDPVRGEPHTGRDAPDLPEVRARLADALDQVADLRHRLDQERAERQQAVERLLAAQERITALLTDQRPAPVRRSWWPRWRR